MIFAVIAIVVLVVLALVGVLSALRRRDTGTAIGALSRETVSRDRGATAPGLIETQPTTGRALERQVALEQRGGGPVEPATSKAPVAWVPPDADAVGVRRRQFLNRSIVGAMVLSLSGFGAAALGFLWPEPKGGFGSKIRVGRIDEIEAQITKANGFYYRADGRMWITAYPPGALEKAKAVYPPTILGGMEAGVVALYQKCPHLGCRVPNCNTSQWFECPCHGSQYNRVGEKRGGPAPRGMDRFAMLVEAGVLTVDTGTIIQGPVIGTNTTGQEPEGPHCTGGGH
jgi:cytochrome b6-f complex iron-sulfur subunit